MKNGAHAIGLFQGMFDKNILTFNPGWNIDAQPLDDRPRSQPVHRHRHHPRFGLPSGIFATRQFQLGSRLQF